MFETDNSLFLADRAGDLVPIWILIFLTKVKIFWMNLEKNSTNVFGEESLLNKKIKK